MQDTHSIYGWAPTLFGHLAARLGTDNTSAIRTTLHLESHQSRVACAHFAARACAIVLTRQAQSDASTRGISIWNSTAPWIAGLFSPAHWRRLGSWLAGCTKPPTPELEVTTKSGDHIRSAEAAALEGPKPASARERIKRATVPVLCYQQLRNWTSSDSHPYRVLSTKAFPHLAKAGYKDRQLQAKELDRAAPLYTLRRSLVVSTWSGAALLRYLRGQHP
jgi:hypothetical protein